MFKNWKTILATVVIVLATGIFSGTGFGLQWKNNPYAPVYRSPTYPQQVFPQPVFPQQSFNAAPQPGFNLTPQPGFDPRPFAQPGQSIGQTPAPQPYSLQFTGEADPQGRGIKVLKVTAGGPTSRLSDPWNPGFPAISLKPGDIIFSVNGFVTRTQQDYQRVMGNVHLNGGSVRISLVDPASGFLRSYTTTAIVGEPDQSIVPEPVAPVKSNPENRRIHLLFCGQSGTNYKIFNDMAKKSTSDFRSMLHWIGDDYLASKTFLTGDDCTAEKIRTTLANLNTSPQDTIFVYFVGHGAHDSNGKHFFQLRETGGADLLREEIQSILLKHSVRLTLLITESCNAKRITPALGETLESFSFKSTTELTQLESLLLDYRGVIDLNSVSRGEYGWGTPVDGGYYTKHFTKEFVALQPTGDWNTGLDNINNRSNDFYRRRRKYFMDLDVAPRQMEGQQNMSEDVVELNVTRDPSGITPGPRRF